MISISLFVMLLATYAYSVPVSMNDNFSKQNLQATTAHSAIMHLLDDGETTVLPSHGQGSFTTGRDGLRFTTQRSFVNKERAPREMLESVDESKVDMAERGMEESSTFESSSQSGFRPRGMVESSTFESSSQSGFRPRGMVESSTFESSSQSGFRPRGMVESSTLESSSQSEFHPREMVESSSTSEVEMAPRGIEGTSTLYPTTVESSSQSGFRPRGMVESSTLVPSMLETSTLFNQRGIRGQNVQHGQDLQTTEVPTSSVSSFAQTTGLFRPRGEQEEEHEHDSSSMSMDEATTEFPSSGKPKTSIEIIPGRNTKTEIIPGPNTKTEIISGPNTKTEIVTDGSGRLAKGKQELSQGKN